MSDLDYRHFEGDLSVECEMTYLVQQEHIIQHKRAPKPVSVFINPDYTRELSSQPD